MPLRISKTLLALVFIFGLVACGEKSNPIIRVTFTGSTDPFADTKVVDLVFIVTNVPVDGKGLDQDQNNEPDAFVFPSGCGNAMAASCGFPMDQAGTVTIGQLPLDFRYSIEARFRDREGNVGYQGTTEFDNNSEAATITISLAAP